jgi:hypothetical protein
MHVPNSVMVGILLFWIHVVVLRLSWIEYRSRKSMFLIFRTGMYLFPILASGLLGENKNIIEEWKSAQLHIQRDTEDAVYLSTLLSVS